jgi:hypothetical protein
MQQTFEINTGQLNQIYDAVIAKFGHRKVKVMIEDVQPETAPSDQEAALKKFAGSWEGDETGDDLVEMIYSARHDRPRDIEL